MKKRITSFIMAAAFLSGCGASQNYSSSPASTTAYSPSARYYEDSVDMYETTTYQDVPAGDCSDMPDENYPQDYTGHNTEEYKSIRENSYKSTLTDPLSTFSADVDTASYTYVRRMLSYGQTIPADAVRIEEMINYLEYSYPEPKEGEPFSVTTEIADCPWNKDTRLMRIGLKTEDIDLSERQPMNLVFLIDVSGSMYDEDKLPLVQKSFHILTDQMTPSDRVSIVTYADGDRVVLDGADGNDRAKILDAIYSLSAGGSTWGSAGIKKAYEIAEDHFIEGGINRVILATDGDLNLGVTSESRLKELIEEKRESGVFLSVFGFGQGNIKDNKMETLADNGNGNYYYIDSEREAQKVLKEEMSGTLITVAKDVKLQVEFNPAYIKGYRQIGYEDRALAAEDFNDEKKDAGEIGAGHTVTALYEIVMKDSPMELTSDLKYTDPSSLGEQNSELLTISVRYKAPDGDESRLLSYPVTEEAYTYGMSGDMRFAAAVAEFGLLLRDSEYKGTADKRSLQELLRECDTAGDEYKEEFGELVRKSRI